MENLIFALLFTLLFVGFIGGGIYIAASATIELKAKARRSAWAILPTDVNGNRPIPFNYDAGYTVEVLSGNALPAPVPQTVTYAPHTIVKSEGRAGGPIEPIQEALAAPPPASVPTFADLLNQGLVGLDKGLFLGFDPEAGALIPGSWKSLYSTALAGMSGSGKTTTVRFLTGQSALMGAKFIVIDPHGHAGENEEGNAESLAESLAPLAPLFLFDVAVEDGEMLAAIAQADRELKKRKAGNRPGYPLIVCVDELSTLMRNERVAGPLQKLLLDIAQEGRKFGVFALAMAQNWKGSTTGGTEVRDSFASNYVHRLKKRQAQLMLPADDVREFKIDQLPAGRAILYQTNGNIIPVAIPNTTSGDIEAVAGLIAGEGKARSWPVPQSENSGNLAATQSDFEVKSISAEDARIFGLFREGKTVSQIVQEIYGLTSKAGAPYLRKNEEVQEALRRAIDGGQPQ